MNYYMRLNWEDPKLAFANIGSRNSIMLDPLDIRGKAGEGNKFTCYTKCESWRNQTKKSKHPLIEIII